MYIYIYIFIYITAGAGRAFVIFAVAVTTLPASIVNREWKGGNLLPGSPDGT